MNILENSDSTPRPKKQQKETKKSNSNNSWVIKVMILSFTISATLSYISKSALSEVNVVIAFVLLLLFIFLGIIFDVLGTAVTAADPKPFNSMASRKVKGARTALFLASKASTVSNICNDVVGDICGIISGTMTAVIAIEISAVLPINELLSAMLMTAFNASLTIGGKALGKSFAINFCENIVFFAGKIICFIIPERFFTKSKK